MCQPLQRARHRRDRPRRLASCAPTSSRPTVGLCRRGRRLADLAPGHQRPDDTRHLVGQGDAHQYRRLAGQHACQPGAWPGPGTGMALEMPLLAPVIRRRRSDRSPILGVAPRRCLPPVECCRGVRPNHAAKSRARRKVSGSDAITAIAVAIRGPAPGTVISLRATSFSLARRAITASSLQNSVSSWVSAATSTLSMAMAFAARPGASAPRA